MSANVIVVVLVVLVLVGVLVVWAIARRLQESERSVDKPNHGNTGGPAQYVDDATLVAYQAPIDITEPSPEFVSYGKTIDITEPSPEFVAGNDRKTGKVPPP